MDASLPVAQALAVKDGRIVEVGGTDEVLWLREDDYEVIDLEGRTVVPGFVDPHNHFSIGAFETLWADCRGARSVADVQRALAAAARAASRRYAALGITAIQDAAVTPAMARRYADARAAGALAIEVGEVMVGARGWFERPDDAAPGRLKIFVDGGYRCAMRVLRDGAPRTSGFLFYTREELTALLRAAWRADRNVVCHAIGNLGIETAVGAIEDAVRTMPEGRARVRIDHAIFLTAELIARIADLGGWVVAPPTCPWVRVA